MKQIQKKIDRQFVLSDSSVNEYGFRLLTSGYQLESFRKNPIGYYMHRREDGIALKWEDLQIDNDQVMGTPVINLSNPRGAQTCEEAENGFLNAASVGHIVVLEYSTDPELMLPGQTGPTITKWYNKECSLVDIPGNCNALTRLYDANENELNLVDMQVVSPIIKTHQLEVIKMLGGLLNIEEPTEQLLAASVNDLTARTAQLAAQNSELLAGNAALRQQMDELASSVSKKQILDILDRALEDRKITVALRDKLATDYANNPEGLQDLIAAMPAYRSIAELLSRQQATAEAHWQWDDYEKYDPAGNKLQALKTNEPERYRALFECKFNAEV